VVNDGKWWGTLGEVSRCLVANRIEHVFMKMMVDPFSWGDIDVLIPRPSGVVEAGNILENQGFTRGSAGRISPPLKSVFERDGVIVEIYPEASWKRGLVADANRIVLNGVQDGGICTPRAEDEFYLIATHAFSHMRVTEADAKNAARLVQNDFDWMRVRDTAALFGTHVSVYFFLKTLYHLEIPEIFPSSVDKIACRLIDRWFEHERTAAFPVRVPRVFGRILAPLHHTPALIRNGTGMREVLYDFVSNLC